jgi:putative ABC transport system permease protein
LGFACVGLVFALVSTTTLMAVQDRVGEHAVLKTLGFSNLRVFGLVLAESVLTSLVGGTVGLLAALALLALGDFAIGAEAVTIAVEPSAALAGWGLLVAAGVGVLSGGLSAWQAARADVVPGLRPA